MVTIKLRALPSSPRRGLADTLRMDDKYYFCIQKRWSIMMQGYQLIFCWQCTSCKLGSTVDEHHEWDGCDREQWCLRFKEVLPFYSQTFIHHIKNQEGIHKTQNMSTIAKNSSNDVGNKAELIFWQNDILTTTEVVYPGGRDIPICVEVICDDAIEKLKFNSQMIIWKNIKIFSFPALLKHGLYCCWQALMVVASNSLWGLRYSQLCGPLCGGVIEKEKCSNHIVVIKIQRFFTLSLYCLHNIVVGYRMLMAATSTLFWGRDDPHLHGWLCDDVLENIKLSSQIMVIKNIKIFFLPFTFKAWSIVLLETGHWWWQL